MNIEKFRFYSVEVTDDTGHKQHVGVMALTQGGAYLAAMGHVPNGVIFEVTTK